MRPLILIAGIGGLIYFGRRWMRSSRVARSQREREPIQRWEGEGGAVPVASNRTAAQVSPLAEAPDPF